MTCPECNWKDYALGEVSAAQRQDMESHLAACADCRAEVGDLQLTLAALRRLPAQELPRRISFVSDPVFAPNWWRRFWASGPQVAFACSAMLAVAILAHAVLRQSPPAASGALPVAQIEQRVQREVEARLPAAVRQAVRTELQPAMDELSARLRELDQTRLAGLERRVEEQRKSDLRNVESAFTYIEKRINTLMTNNVRYGGD
jgi:anti-sigma factor RsiW